MWFWFICVTLLPWPVSDIIIKNSSALQDWQVILSWLRATELLWHSGHVAGTSSFNIFKLCSVDVINYYQRSRRVWPFNQFWHIKFAGSDQGFCVYPAMMTPERRIGIFHLALVLLREACDWIITFDQVSVIMYHLANLCFYPSIFHAMNVPFVAPRPRKNHRPRSPKDTYPKRSQHLRMQ